MASTDLKDRFQKHLEDWDCVSATRIIENAILDPASQQWLEENAALELIPVAVNYLTDEQQASGPHVVDGCARLIRKLAKFGSPKEVLIALIEHCEAFESSLKFRLVLPAMTVVMDRLFDDPKTKRKLGLTWDWVLDTVLNHILSLILPEMGDCLANSQERLLLDSDSKMAEVLDTLLVFSSFLQPLLDQLQRGPFEDLKSCKNHLIRTCMSTLASPLVNLNLEVHVASSSTFIKSRALVIAENFSGIIINLEPNVFQLSTLDDRFLTRDSFSENGEDAKTKARDQWVLAFGVLFFIIYNDHTVTQREQKKYFIEKLPCVHTPFHVFNLLLPSINSMMSDNHFSTFKALHLSGNLLDRIKVWSLDAQVLELKTHTEFLQKVMRVIVYNSVEEFRRKGFQIFGKYFELFSPDSGSYRLCVMLIEIANHSGLIGYVIGKVKDITIQGLNGTLSAPQFQGHSLKVLIRKVAKLSNGPETDLLEISDELMAGINFLICLCLRDKTNKTGIWDLKSELENDFVIPMETAINMSRAHYQAQLEAPASVEDDNVSLRVGGQPLPLMNPKQRKDVIKAALNTFSMIECVLIQLKDIWDRNK